MAIKKQTSTSVKRHPLVAEREPKNGNFAKRANLRVRLEDVMRGHCIEVAGVTQPAYNRLTAPQQVALGMYAEKISRILNGDPNELDHWRDIGGYSELVIETLPQEV